MTALTSDTARPYTAGVEAAVPVYRSVEIFGNALVGVNAAGYAVPGDDAAGLIFMGVAREHVDNSSGSDGDKQVVVRRRGLWKMTLGTPISQANVGDQVFLVDDNTVDLAANVTHNIFCGIIAAYIDSIHAWIDIEPAIKHDSVDAHIADADGAHAASAISIADAGGFTAQIEVEAALQEIYPKVPAVITDPGNAGAIPVIRSGSAAITTAGAETRTLAIPAAAGITLVISLDVDGGDCVITAAAAVNQAGNNTITMNDAGDTIVLTAVQVGGSLVWRVVSNDGCSLSTV